mgnify:CR=1 FL=1
MFVASLPNATRRLVGAACHSAPTELSLPEMHGCCSTHFGQMGLFDRFRSEVVRHGYSVSVRVWTLDSVVWLAAKERKGRKALGRLFPLYCNMSKSIISAKIS